jgi:hypothetical protein
MKTRERQSLDPKLEAKLTRLRHLLQTERELAQVSEYFHTVLVPDDAFMTSGLRTEHPRLLTALHAVLRSVDAAGRLNLPLMFQVGGLCHGYARASSGHLLFFYFEALDLGFCSYARSLTDPEVTFVRFQLKDLNGDSWFGKARRGCA